MTRRQAKTKQPYEGWQRIVDAISDEYQRANGVPCPWGNKLAFRRLDELVRGNPKWTADDWIRCVRNRFASEDISPAEAPEAFVRFLPRYVAGPLDRFHLPKQAPPAQEGTPEYFAKFTKPTVITEGEREDMRRLEEKWRARSAGQKG